MVNVVYPILEENGKSIRNFRHLKLENVRYLKAAE